MLKNPQSTCSAVILLMIGWLLFAMPVLASNAQPIGRVVWVTGSVQAELPGQMPRLLKRGDVVYERETITTNKTGSGQVVFTDGSLVALRQDSAITIERYHYNQATPQNNSYSATVIKGGFRTVTGLISKEKPEAYQVKTPVATIGVRGTQYSLFYSATAGLSLKLDNGVIEVSNQVGKLVLDSKLYNVFASITSATSLPTLLKVRPAVFEQEPALVPAKAADVEASTTPAATQSTQTTQTTTEAVSTDQPTSRGGSKVVTDFCIQ